MEQGESGSRYDTRRATDEVERVRKHLGIPRKEIAEVIGTDRFGWSHKLKMKKSRFTPEEFGAIADHFKAPRAWPWYTWAECEKIERLADALRDINAHKR